MANSMDDERAGFPDDAETASQAEEEDDAETPPPAVDHTPSPDGPCIWAVGGGKGGVGKSMVTTSLAVALAGRGQRVVVVDADLGGANVDTVFGISRPPRTLSEFFAGEVPRLADVLSPTSGRTNSASAHMSPSSSAVASSTPRPASSSAPTSERSAALSGR
jgi:Mrp family chromosome partitioning ATPase